MPSVKLERPRVSFADLQQAPEDGRRYELYDGEVFVVPAPIPLHQIAVQRFAELLRVYSRSHGGLVFLSPIDIVFSEFDVVEPERGSESADRIDSLASGPAGKGAAGRYVPQPNYRHVFSALRRKLGRSGGRR